MPFLIHSPSPVLRKNHPKHVDNMWLLAERSSRRERNPFSEKGSRRKARPRCSPRTRTLIHNGWEDEQPPSTPRAGNSTASSLNPSAETGYLPTDFPTSQTCSRYSVESLSAKSACPPTLPAPARYPHPPHRAEQHQKTINRVDISHLFSVQLQCSLGPKPNVCEH